MSLPWLDYKRLCFPSSGCCPLACSDEAPCGDAHQARNWGLPPVINRCPLKPSIQLSMGTLPANSHWMSLEADCTLMGRSWAPSGAMFMAWERDPERKYPVKLCLASWLRNHEIRSVRCFEPLSSELICYTAHRTMGHMISQMAREDTVVRRGRNKNVRVREIKDNQVC